MCKIILQARDTHGSNKTKGAKPELQCLTQWKCYKTKHIPPFALIKWRHTSNSACSHYLHPSPVTSSSFPFLILGRTPPGSSRVKRAFFLNISTRNLPAFSLCGTILLSLDLLDFQALFHLLSLPSSCSKSNDWAVPHVLLQQRNVVQ